MAVVGERIACDDLERASRLDHDGLDERTPHGVAGRTPDVAS